MREICNENLFIKKYLHYILSFEIKFLYAGNPFP